MSKQKKDKKPFKETGFGKLLLQKIPSAAGLIGNLLPDSGVFGIAKNLISAATKSGELDPVDAADLEDRLNYELETYKVEVEDRKSARSREVEMAKTGKSDWMMNLSGIFALLAMCVVVYVALFMDVKDNNIFMFIAGAVFGYASSVMNYYFGSSKGSKDKDAKFKL